MLSHAFGMPQAPDESVERWHARALKECLAAGEAWGALSRRTVTIGAVFAGDVFGPVDEDYATVFASLNAARVELLAAADELGRTHR